MDFFGGPPPLQMAVELAYFISISALSLLIFYRSKQVYDLTKYESVLHFRNIFLYFSIAYLFRLILILPMLSGAPPSPQPDFIIPLLLVVYFSTAALISLALAAGTRLIEGGSVPPLAVHAVALLICAGIFLSHSPLLVIAVQTVIVLLSAVFAVLRLRASEMPLLTQNSITYLLLCVFWILSTVTFAGRFFPLEFTSAAYLLSVAIFVSIYLRASKRLS